VIAETIRYTAETIRYTADTIVLGHDPTGWHVLLIRRAADHDTEPGKWALPGGHVDADETGRAAAARELFEESGLPLTAGEERRMSMVGVYDTPGRDPRGRYVSAAYAIVLPQMVDVAGGDDADRAEWVPVAEALDRTLAFDHDVILRDAVAKHRTLRNASVTRDMGPHRLIDEALSRMWDEHAAPERLDVRRTR
jgi:8-oxo-dGTP diphosphatase